MASDECVKSLEPLRGHGVWRAIRTLSEARRWRSFRESHPLRRHEAGLLVQYGIGDHFLTCGLAWAIREHTGYDVVVAGKAGFAFIAELFPGVSRFVTLPKELWKQESGTTQIVSGEYMYAHFRSLELMRAVGYQGFHLLDAYKCLFSLPAQTTLENPRKLSDLELAEAKTFLEAQGLRPGFTAILCPNAGSTPIGNVDNAFWSELAFTLRENGLEPVVNVGPGTEVPKGLEGVAFPLSSFRALVQQAGFFCGVRSGICDLVSDLPVRQAVIYPDIIYHAGPLIKGTALRTLGFPHFPLEIVFAPAEKEACLARLKSHLC